MRIATSSGMAIGTPTTPSIFQKPRMGKRRGERSASSEWGQHASTDGRRRCRGNHAFTGRADWMHGTSVAVKGREAHPGLAVETALVTGGGQWKTRKTKNAVTRSPHRAQQPNATVSRDGAEAPTGRFAIRAVVRAARGKATIRVSASSSGRLRMPGATTIDSLERAKEWLAHGRACFL